jgi:hypothetical protein
VRGDPRLGSVRCRCRPWRSTRRCRCSRSIAILRKVDNGWVSGVGQTLAGSTDSCSGGGPARRPAPTAVWTSSPRTSAGLMLQVDHVVPLGVAKSHGVPLDLYEDMFNLVLACAGCNGFDNRYRYRVDLPPRPPGRSRSSSCCGTPFFAERYRADRARRADEQLLRQAPEMLGVPAPALGVTESGCSYLGGASRASAAWGHQAIRSTTSLPRAVGGDAPPEFRVSRGTRQSRPQPVSRHLPRRPRQATDPRGRKRRISPRFRRFGASAAAKSMLRSSHGASRSGSVRTSSGSGSCSC